MKRIGQHWRTVSIAFGVIQTYVIAYFISSLNPRTYVAEPSYFILICPNLYQGISELNFYGGCQSGELLGDRVSMVLKQIIQLFWFAYLYILRQMMIDV